MERHFIFSAFSVTMICRCPVYLTLIAQYSQIFTLIEYKYILIKKTVILKVYFIEYRFFLNKQKHILILKQNRSVFNKIYFRYIDFIILNIIKSVNF